MTRSLNPYSLAAVRSKAPYKAIITHGFTLDESSRKMSKSLGNIIPPSAVIHGSNQSKLKSPKLKGIGVDGLRLWVSSTDYMRDVNVGEKVLSAVGESVRKIRNTGRFMLGNLHGFNANEGSLRYAQLDPVCCMVNLFGIYAAVSLHSPFVRSIVICCTNFKT